MALAVILLFIVAPIVVMSCGFCVCFLFYDVVLGVFFSSFSNHLAEETTSWFYSCCCVAVSVLCLFLTVLLVGLWSVIVAFPGQS